MPTVRAILADVAQRARRIARGKPQRSRTKLASRHIESGKSANDVIASIIDAGAPAMIARLGTTESAVVEYFAHHGFRDDVAFPQELKTRIHELSGFFPPSDQLLTQFSRESLAHLGEADVMGVRVKPSDWTFWGLEDFLIERYSPQAALVQLGDIMPVGNPQSWTRSLRGKRVLVIHPFSQTIENQFLKREFLFEDPDFLPDCDLQVIPAVQSVGDNSGTLPFADWYQALNHMKSEISKRSFDVALIGAGAYGLFLAAECKRLGAIGIQVGGALQLLFGIKGGRWTNPGTSDSEAVLPLVNEFWVSPSAEERPRGADLVEDGCYW